MINRGVSNEETDCGERKVESSYKHHNIYTIRLMNNCAITREEGTLLDF